MVARDDDGAPARGLRGVDPVLDAQAHLVVAVAQDCRVLVVAHAADVDDAVGRQQILCSARRVLRRPARHRDGIILGEQLLIDLEHVFHLGLVCQDGIVLSHLVLV